MAFTIVFLANPEDKDRYLPSSVALLFGIHLMAMALTLSMSLGRLLLPSA